MESIIPHRIDHRRARLLFITQIHFTMRSHYPAGLLILSGFLVGIGTKIHFDENSKILIRGYIDYLMSRP